jgi:hypothetical protein
MNDPWIRVEDWLIDFKIQEQKIRLHSQQTPTSNGKIFELNSVTINNKIYSSIIFALVTKNLYQNDLNILSM